ncbi:MAG: pilus assembly protein PilP [Comamonadaceae bacterium CG_4_9_14_3_um_filter_60_33]|nr:MAG: pilus assembly protein PilP [Comamonadaceae bacterium CG2_30_59_20]PIY27732.1 MAG: pilus assembly protein PilP [Comamonadaceae bacterium CG_4_10_14_3_um_filter_60_42]PJB41453.1 MAG: pilus assembly protein PilP [Comamonadaceae bacterium CG_4_9_14_3_um_filter_60_33]
MKLFKTAVLCLVMGLLTACGSSSQDELSQWMAQQKVQTQPKIKPVSAPKPFKPENYNLFAELDPYNKQKLIMVLSNDANQAAANGALIAPELARRKEPLEEFPLDAMALVGSMVSSKQPVALVKIGPLLYQVKLGDYLGQNYGKVIKIVENEVTLREIVQDAVGEWVERTASLLLQERSK